MANKEDHGSEGTGMGSNPTAENTPLKIRWDRSNMRSAYANVFKVAFTREEITLCFGMSQACDADQKEGTIQRSERILLNPFTIKRLVAALSRALQDYESKYGPLKLESPPSATPEPMALPCGVPSLSKKEKADEKAGLVFQLVDNLNIKYGFEQSFKIFERTLLANRFLLGFKKERIRQEPHERILDICRRMDMPEDLLETYRERLSEANYLHFGFEENQRTYLYKAYMEFYDKFERGIKSQPGKLAPFLMFLGFKWDALDHSKRVLTRYTWYPLLSVEGMVARLSNILDSHKHRNLFEITEGILGMASRKLSPHDIFYLEVAEENNPRRSFDINMYRAKLQLSELQPWLAKMRQHYVIPSEEFHAACDAAKTKTFGHFSGGIDREGRDFLTVYYGVEYTSPRGSSEPRSDKSPKEHCGP